MKGAYIRADFDKDVEWFILEGWRDNKFDLFGDGKIIIYFTPGHTPGHQSILVNLENTGPVFLSADSCYTIENIDEDVLPGLGWSPSLSLQSIKMMKHLRDEMGVKIITGHDPVAWKQYKKAPEYYD
jgi:glyoxylase-like metal-dependent hydrolase (beta-lactamase superfamily II)